MRSAWSWSSTASVISRIDESRPTLMVVTSPIRPPPSAIVPATVANWPVRCGNWMRYV